MAAISRPTADIHTVTAKLRDRLELMLATFARVNLTAPQRDREFQRTLQHVFVHLEAALGPLPSTMTVHFAKAAKCASHYNAGRFVRAVDTPPRRRADLRKALNARCPPRLQGPQSEASKLSAAQGPHLVERVQGRGAADIPE